MKSIIFKATSLALAAGLVIATAGVGSAEAGHRHHGFHKFHGHGHGHVRFHRFHFVHRPIYYSYGYSPKCFYKWGKKFCKY